MLIGLHLALYYHKMRQISRCGHTPIFFFNSFSFNQNSSKIKKKKTAKKEWTILLLKSWDLWQIKSKYRPKNIPFLCISLPIAVLSAIRITISEQWEQKQSARSLQFIGCFCIYTAQSQWYHMYLVHYRYAICSLSPIAFSIGCNKCVFCLQMNLYVFFFVYTYIYYIYCNLSFSLVWLPYSGFV